MQKELIIRVPEGTPEEHVKLMMDALAAKYSYDKYRIDKFSADPGDSLSYARRADSLRRAFDFLLKAYPVPEQATFFEPEIIKTVSKECAGEYEGTSNSIDVLEKNLKAYGSKINTLVCTIWNVSSRDAVTLLSDAEVYSLLEIGRADIATFMKMDATDTEYVLLLEQALPAHNDRFIAELEKIKNAKCPETPSWFKSLSAPENHYQLAYLYYIQQDSSNNLMSDFAEFERTLERAKSTADNFSFQLEQIKTGAEFLPEWFMTLKKHQQEMMSELVQKHGEIDHHIQRFKKQLDHYQANSDGLNELRALPLWYWFFPRHQQCFLKHLFTKKEDLENPKDLKELFFFLSSRLRNFPVPSNYAQHSFIIMEDNGTLIELYDPIPRSSHIAPLKPIKEGWPNFVVIDYARAIWNKVMEGARDGQQGFTQTLISPSELSKFFALPDQQLNKIAHKVVTGAFTNHPLNWARIIDYTQADNKDCHNFIKKAQEQFATLSPQLQAVLAKNFTAHIDNYKKTLNSPRGSATYADYYGRELCLSSLEQLIVTTAMGYFYSTCASSKDRRAIVFIHTDAMCYYHYKYKKWPACVYNDSPEDALERKNFINIVAKLYLTPHHQEHAGQNAPGANAIKTPDVYLPMDICEEIKRIANKPSILTDSDKKADKNEVSKISKEEKPVVFFNALQLPAKDVKLCKMVANQLGQDKCTELYNKLSLLLGQRQLFNSSLPVIRFFKVSEGIELMRSVMNNPAPKGMCNVTEDNINRMEKIFAICLYRTEVTQQSVGRPEATQTVYDGLNRILKISRNDSRDDVVKEVLRSWTELYDNSRENRILSFS